MCNESQIFRKDEQGSSIVEFAFVAPILISMLFGIVSYGAIISIENSVQQIVAESARASVAGLSDSERSTLAQSYVAAIVTSYPLIDPSKLSVSTDTPTSTTFRVLAHYDMSGSFVYRALNGFPLPNPITTRTAVVQRGGF